MYGPGWSGRKRTINGAAGMHPKILDRMDLRLECIRRHYTGEPSPLQAILDRYADFFGLFDDFDGYINHFLFQDFVEDGQVTFVLPFDNFTSPRTAAGYRESTDHTSQQIHARNQRISA